MLRSTLKHAAVPAERLNRRAPPADSKTKRLLAVGIFAGAGREHRHETLGVVRGGNQNGVYIVAVNLNGDMHYGIMNIGRRPTLSKQMHISIEVHIFITSGNLYGQFLQIALLDRLRDEIRFDNREQLIGQIETDIAFAQERLPKLETDYNNEQFSFFKE